MVRTIEDSEDSALQREGASQRCRVWHLIKFESSALQFTWAYIYGTYSGRNRNASPSFCDQKRLNRVAEARDIANSNKVDFGVRIEETFGTT